MLPKNNRLKKEKDFEKVFKTGKGFKEDFLFLKVVDNGLKNSRFGFVVSKKFSPRAVLRNKAKRRIRELVRLKLKRIKTGKDCVLVAYSGLKNEDFWETKETIEKLFQRSGLI